MMHLVGGSLMTGACFWLGWSRFRWYGAWHRTLSQLCVDLARMESELRERETDTESLLSLLAEGTGCTAMFYQRCLELMRSGSEASFSKLWNGALEASSFPLRQEEQMIWQRVGQILGRYTGQEQATLLSGLSRELETFRQAAREEWQQRGRIAVVLGLTLGLTLALVLV